MIDDTQSEYHKYLHEMTVHQIHKYTLSHCSAHQHAPRKYTHELWKKLSTNNSAKVVKFFSFMEISITNKGNKELLRDNIKQFCQV